MVLQNNVTKVFTVAQNISDYGWTEAIQYFPKEAGSLKFGDITVELIDKKVYETFKRRSLTVNGVYVEHIHFEEWYDLEVPQYDVLPEFGELIVECAKFIMA